jgi:hypothetical protein
MTCAEADLTDQDPRDRQMTVARLREAGAHVDVMFYESARIYRLQRDNPAFNATLRELRAAIGSGAPLRVRLATPHGDVIEGAKAAR